MCRLYMLCPDQGVSAISIPRFLKCGLALDGECSGCILAWSLVDADSVHAWTCVHVWRKMCRLR